MLGSPSPAAFLPVARAAAEDLPDSDADVTRHTPAGDASPHPQGKQTNPKDALGSGRLPLGLVPDTAVAAMALAFLEGASKYGRYNWRAAGVRASIYHDAVRRHLAKWWGGEECDPATGVPHLASALAGLAIVLDARACGKLTDDRPPRAPVSAQIDASTADVARLKALFADHAPRQWTIADSPEIEAEARALFLQAEAARQDRGEG